MPIPRFRKRAWAYYEKAMLSEKHKQRIELLEQAVALNTQFSDAYMELGKSYKYLKEFDKAEKALRASIALDNNGWAHLYLGNLFFGHEEWDAAEKEFIAAKECFPDISAPLWCIGDVYRERGNFKKSERFYRAAVTIDPANAEAMARLGQLLLERGKREEGVMFIKRALNQDSDCKVALRCKKQFRIRTK